MPLPTEREHDTPTLDPPRVEDRAGRMFGAILRAMCSALVLALAFASTGCHLVFALEDNPVARDANGDGTDSTIPDSCYGTGDVVVCPRQPLPPTMTVPTVINTDASECIDLDPPSTPNICAIGATTLVISGLQATGADPIVIVGDTITVGAIDVSSGPGSAVGAGARKSCPLAGTPASMAGGAGGSHGALGGSGGKNGNNSPGGTPGAVPPPEVLRGGCQGQNIGVSLGGKGGGAVAVLARTKLTISGSINASGAPGAGGAAAGAGPGGGAGGMIYLDSPDIGLGAGAQVFANGGGGGEAGEVGTPGMPGLKSTNATTPGFGGTGAGEGGDGGYGGYRDFAAANGNDGQPGVGGGGGGGAVGAIRIRPNPVGDASNVSPLPTP